MLALLTSAELPAIDRHMAETGTPNFVLMERAGAAVAREVDAFAPKARRIVVVAGPNNNGGDCMCAARIMMEAGRDVVVALFAERSELPPDPAKAAAQWRGPLVRATPAALAGADLIVDGLYGGGLKHEVAGDAAKLVEAINASPGPVLAVDFPSGVSGVTGTILGTAVKADRTITFFCLKPGHLLMPGRLQCGPIVVDPIGIPASVMDTVGPRAFHNRPELWSAALPDWGGQKPGRRRIVVVPGTARTGDGAQRVAAGARAAGVDLAASSTEADAAACPDALGPDKAGAAALATGLPVVLGCSGAPTSPADLDLLFSDIQARKSPAVLVLDGARFARLFPSVSAGSRLEQVREAATISGAIVAYLGSDRVVAAPDRRAAIANNAAPDPIVEGAADVLVGLIGALMARGAPPFEAAAAAVWLLGRADGRPNANARLETLSERLAVSLQDAYAAAGGETPSDPPTTAFAQQIAIRHRTGGPSDLGATR